MLVFFLFAAMLCCKAPSAQAAITARIAATKNGICAEKFFHNKPPITFAGKTVNPIIM